jgi:hypothetical protein
VNISEAGSKIFPALAAPPQEALTPIHMRDSVLPSDAHCGMQGEESQKIRQVVSK